MEGGGSMVQNTALRRVFRFATVCLTGASVFAAIVSAVPLAQATRYSSQPGVFPDAAVRVVEAFAGREVQQQDSVSRSGQSTNGDRRTADSVKSQIAPATRNQKRAVQTPSPIPAPAVPQDKGGAATRTSATDGSEDAQNEAARETPAQSGGARGTAGPPVSAATSTEDRRGLEALQRERAAIDRQIKSLRAQLDKFDRRDDGRDDRQMQDLRRRLDRANDNARTLVNQIAAATSTAERARAAETEAREAARRKAVEDERERERLLWIVGGIAFLTFLGAGIAAVLLLTARRRQRDLALAAEELKENEERRQRAGDWALTSSNRRLKLTGAALSDPQRGVVVGRSAEEADVLIEGNEVSRRHARFHLEDDRFYVTDLNSLNGVSINGKKIPANSPQRVKPGDEVSIANSHFELRRL